MKSKLTINYYLKRVLKSENIQEMLNNQADMILFLNRRYQYEQTKFLENNLKLLRTVNTDPSSKPD